jgi:hypothetical protein
VQDVLNILALTPGPEDMVSPPPETPITNDMSIVIGLTRVVSEVVEESVPPAMVYESDATLAAGQVRVAPGVPGLKQTTYRVTYKNGAEANRTATGSSVVRAASPTRHITGTKGASGGPLTLDVPGYSGPYASKLTVRATWYNATHGAWASSDPNYGLTRSGVMLDYGICAVDPNVIPLGTRFYVPGYGHASRRHRGRCEGKHRGPGLPGRGRGKSVEHADVGHLHSRVTLKSCVEDHARWHFLRR